MTWVGMTAREIARAVRRGDATATEVVADHLDYIAAVDAQLSAFRIVRAGAAIAEAEKVDEQPDLSSLPLAGVPIAVKENTPVAGLPTWHGSAAARPAPTTSRRCSNAVASAPGRSGSRSTSSRATPRTCRSATRRSMR